MNEKTIIILARLACGTAILVTSTITGMNGVLQGISLFLLGVPVEYAAASKEKD